MQMIDMRTMKPESPEPSELDLELSAEHISALGLVGVTEIGKEIMLKAKACITEVGVDDAGKPRIELKIKAMQAMVDGENDDGEVRDAPSGKVSPGKLRSVMGYYS